MGIFNVIFGLKSRSILLFQMLQNLNLPPLTITPLAVASIIDHQLRDGTLLLLGSQSCISHTLPITTEQLQSLATLSVSSQVLGWVATTLDSDTKDMFHSLKEIVDEPLVLVMDSKYEVKVFDCAPCGLDSNIMYVPRHISIVSTTPTDFKTDVNSIASTLKSLISDLSHIESYISSSETVCLY